nr:hypothetical protein [Tanacetum cinerariifolium]
GPSDLNGGRDLNFQDFALDSSEVMTQSMYDRNLLGGSDVASRIGPFRTLPQNVQDMALEDDPLARYPQQERYLLETIMENYGIDLAEGITGLNYYRDLINRKWEPTTENFTKLYSRKKRERWNDFLNGHEVSRYFGGLDPTGYIFINRPSVTQLNHQYELALNAVLNSPTERNWDEIDRMDESANQMNISGNWDDEEEKKEDARPRPSILNKSSKTIKKKSGGGFSGVFNLFKKGGVKKSTTKKENRGSTWVDQIDV